MSQQDLPVVIIGAGPVGLAAAAHTLARGLTPVVLEAGSRVGDGGGHGPDGMTKNLRQPALSL